MTLSTCVLLAALAARTCHAEVTAQSPLLTWLLQHGGGASVKPGVANGLRGLVVERKCAVGDVILEVPLSLAISDGGDDSIPLEGAAPEWAHSLPWNVQLAMTILGNGGGAASAPAAAGQRAPGEWHPHITGLPPAPAPQSPETHQADGPPAS